MLLSFLDLYDLTTHFTSNECIVHTVQIMLKAVAELLSKNKEVQHLIQFVGDFSLKG